MLLGGWVVGQISSPFCKDATRSLSQDGRDATIEIRYPGLKPDEGFQVEFVDLLEQDSSAYVRLGYTAEDKGLTLFCISPSTPANDSKLYGQIRNLSKSSPISL